MGGGGGSTLAPDCSAAIPGLGGTFSGASPDFTGPSCDTATACIVCITGGRAFVSGRRSPAGSGSFALGAPVASGYCLIKVISARGSSTMAWVSSRTMNTVSFKGLLPTTLPGPVAVETRWLSRGILLFINW